MVIQSRCAQCGYILNHVNDACPVCLPNFYSPGPKATQPAGPAKASVIVCDRCGYMGSILLHGCNRSDCLQRETAGPATAEAVDLETQAWTDAREIITLWRPHRPEEVNANYWQTEMARAIKDMLIAEREAVAELRREVDIHKQNYADLVDGIETTSKATVTALQQRAEATEAKVAEMFDMMRQVSRGFGNETTDILEFMLLCAEKMIDAIPEEPRHDN